MEYSEELLIFIQTRINQLESTLAYILDFIRNKDTKSAELLIHVAKADFAILKLLLPSLKKSDKVEELNQNTMEESYKNYEL